MMSGREPILPVDLVYGRIQDQKRVSDYVQDLNIVLRSIVRTSQKLVTVKREIMTLRRLTRHFLKGMVFYCLT